MDSACFVRRSAASQCDGRRSDHGESSLNILFASTVFPHPSDPTRGVYNLSLCRALARAGAEVRVVCPREWTEVLRRRDGGPLDLAPLKRVEYPVFFYPPGVGRRHLSRWLGWSGKAAVRRVTRNWRPDVVLSYWADPDAAAAIKWAELSGVKSAFIAGGSDVLMLPDRPHLRDVIEAVIGRSDLVFTVSETLATRVHELDSDGRTQVVCVPQGIDADRFFDGPKQDARWELGLTEAPTFLCVGRLHPVKNHALLLEAFAKVRDKLADARLLIVGEGPELARIRAAIDRLGLSDGVRLAKAVPPDRLGGWYRACDAVVLSSHSEGLPNVLRESLACGRPFASVDVGGVREIGDDTCRVLCPPGDADALADAMLRVTGERYAAAAAAYPSRSWDDMAAEVLREFSGLLVGRVRPDAKRS